MITGIYFNLGERGIELKYLTLCDRPPAKRAIIYNSNQLSDMNNLVNFKNTILYSISDILCCIIIYLCFILLGTFQINSCAILKITKICNRLENYNLNVCFEKLYCILWFQYCYPLR